jgi:hypothetical protein
MASSKAARAASEIWLSSSDSSGQAADWPAPLEKGRLMPIHQITGLYRFFGTPCLERGSFANKQALSKERLSLRNTYEMTKKITVEVVVVPVWKPQ